MFSLVLVGAIEVDLACGQTPLLWGNLEPGPYAVGFRNLEKFDYTRTYRSKRDYFGKLLPGESARPIQICVWYPAENFDKSASMALGEYLFPYPDTGFFEFLSGVQNRELMYLMTSPLSERREEALDLLSLAAGAAKDAPACEGLFPLIVYAPDMGRGIAENFVLCEYLASHGFIVAGAHSIGTFALVAELNPRDRETMVRDNEFLLAEMREFPNVDLARIGALGYSAGGLTSLLMGMRNSGIEATASIEGLYLSRERFDLTRQSPYFDLEKLITPHMTIYTDSEGTPDFSLLDSLRYSSRYACRIGNTTRRELTSYGNLSSISLYSDEETPSSGHPGYATACEYLYHFFDAYLNGYENSLKFINSPPANNGFDPDLVNLKVRRADDPPPTREQFVTIVTENGIEKAIEIFNKFKNSGYVLFEEAAFNAIGYQYLQRGDIEGAIAIFTMNTEFYPKSANTWDSLAEACEAGGRTELAIRYLKKVLEVLPDDSNIDSRFKQALKTRAEEGLSRLGG